MIILPIFVDLICWILDTFFVSKAPGIEDKEDKDEGDHQNKQHSGNNKGPDTLEAACNLFEITSIQDTTLDYVRKKYKKLSLMYHPDRNGNSKESHEMMQKVNNFYDILQEEVEKLERVSKGEPERDCDYGVDHSDNYERSNEGDSGEECEHPMYGKFSYYKTEADLPKGKKSRKFRKEWHKRQGKQQETMRKQQEASRQRYKEQRAKMEKEMFEQMKEIRKKRKKMERDIWQTKKEHKLQQKKKRLDTDIGRAHANEIWKAHVAEIKERQKQRESEAPPPSVSSNTDTGSETLGSDMDDIDEDNYEPGSHFPGRKNKDRLPVQKPANAVMDYSTTNIAIALRKNFTEIALDIIQDDLLEYLKKELKRELSIAFYSNQPEPDPEEIISRLSKQYFLKPLDDDENTLLHYAVYFENEVVIEYIVYRSREFGIFFHLFLEKNCHGNIPLDYSIGCKNKRIDEKVKAFTDTAQSEFDEKYPTVETLAQKLIGITRHVSIVPILNTLASLAAGTQVFGCGAATSIMICVLAQITSDNSERLSDERDRVAVLFASHLTLWLLLMLSNFWWQNVPWEIYVLLVPIAILWGCATNAIQFCTTFLLLPYSVATRTILFLSFVLSWPTRDIIMPTSISRNQLERLTFLGLFSGTFLFVITISTRLH